VSAGQVSARVLIRGRVQGVWFRGATQEEAVRCGVAGWVRNLPDGRVEAWFEGDRASVEAMVAWAGRGPRHAQVEELSVSWGEAEGLGGFVVRRGEG